MKKNKFLILLSFLIIGIILVVIGIQLGGSISASFHDFNITFNNRNKLDTPITEAFTNIKHINISSTSPLNIDILKGDEFKVVYDDPYLEINQNVIDEVNALHLVSNGSDNHFIFGINTNTAYDITIYIPDDLESLIINSALVDIDISNINVSDLNIDVDLGNIIVNSIITDTITATSDLGNFEFSNITSNGTTLTSNLGNIIIKFSTLGDLTTTSDLGNIEVLNNKFKSFNHSVSLGNIVNLNNEIIE